VADPVRADHQPGWLEVFTVAAIVVAVVLGLAAATSLLPTTLQQVVFHTPIAIVVLLVGTTWILWRISRNRPDSPDGPAR
jgi:heme A synthase